MKTRQKVSKLTAERCWEMLCSDGQMYPRCEKILATGEPKALLAFARLLYVAGFERGFAVGAEVGPEPELASDEDE